jgi:hypothetical protein
MTTIMVAAAFVGGVFVGRMGWGDSIIAKVKGWFGGSTAA